jgi:hypothetical protein
MRTPQTEGRHCGEVNEQCVYHKSGRRLTEYYQPPTELARYMCNYQVKYAISRLCQVPVY